MAHEYYGLPLNGVPSCNSRHVLWLPFNCLTARITHDRLTVLLHSRVAYDNDNNNNSDKDFSALFVFIAGEYSDGVNRKQQFDIYIGIGRHRIMVSVKVRFYFFRYNNGRTNFDLYVPENQKQVSQQQLTSTRGIVLLVIVQTRPTRIIVLRVTVTLKCTSKYERDANAGEGVSNHLTRSLEIKDNKQFFQSVGTRLPKVI